MELMALAGTSAAAAGGTAAAAGAATGFASTAMMAGTILGGVGQIISGIGAKREAGFEADQMLQNAGQERASSQRAATEERRQKRLVESRAQAVAAASGGGASDPTVVDIMGDLETQGEYKALTALWDGEERARGLEGAASAKKAQGSMALTQGLIGAAGTFLQGGESLFDKYATKKKSYPSSYVMKNFDSVYDRYSPRTFNG